MSGLSSENFSVEEFLRTAGNMTQEQLLELIQSFEYGEIIQLPAGLPPDGTTPIFDNPPRRDALAITIVVICTLMATIAVGLRVYAKAWCVRMILVEDYLGLGSFLAQLISTGAMCAMVAERLFFVHVWDMRFGDVERLNYLMLIFGSSQAIVMMLIKSAILWEWIRIFVPRRKRGAFYYIGLFTLIINVCYSIASLFTVNFGCNPREKLYRVWLSGTCISSRYEIYVVLGVFALISHLMILLLPQPIIWRLYLPAKRRLGISIIFSFGILACATASGRLAWVIRMDYVNDPTGGGADWSYDISTVVIWGLVEMMCLTLVFCVPAVPRIFTQSVTILPIQRAKRTPKSSKLQNSTDTWPLTALPPNQNKSYQKMSDGKTQGQDSSRVGSHVSLGNDGFHNGILKVVEITMEEEQVSTISRDGLLPAQHPWDTKRT